MAERTAGTRLAARSLTERGSSATHEICHHRPVNSWMTKPGARLSRAGVATRPTSTSLCVSSEGPRPTLPARNSAQDSFNGR